MLFPLPATTTTMHTTIASLPVELLSRIFALGTADQYSDSPFLLRPDEDHCSAAPADFQLLVSQICRHWRQVALRTSCLWTSLHFRGPEHIARARAFLERASASYSLDILVDTVSPDEHIPGVTLCCDEMRIIFDLITPHVARWRAFHLKVRANECKLIARQALSTCGPAPRLETLQLYHFEDYRTSHNLYIATYRDPVIIFNNVLPSLKNVSLIGVNLPWKQAPYLQQLDALELALHPDNIRPPYDAWNAMLRGSPGLRRLLLHYSGPRQNAASDAGTGTQGASPGDGEPRRICVPTLEELSLTDLDPEHLANMLRTLELPHLGALAMDLPEQDFTDVVRLMTASNSAPPTSSRVLPPPPPAPLPLNNLHTLRISALECQVGALAALIRGASALRVLELDFSRVSGKQAVCDVLLETMSTVGEETRRVPVLPQLEEARLFGLDGSHTRALIGFRAGFVGSADAHLREGVGDVGATVGVDVDVKERARPTMMPRFFVRWDARRPAVRDKVLDELVAAGKVECLPIEGEEEEEEEEEEEYSDSADQAGPDTSESSEEAED